MPLSAIIVTATLTAVSQAARPGSILGCVTDNAGQQLSGVSVIAKGGGVERIATADASGCYELNDLPSATYRVTLRLLGFDNVTRDRMPVDTGGTSRFDVTMRVSPICECIGVAGELADHWKHATAVFYVRLSDSEPDASTPQGYYRHAATVLTVLKAPRQFQTNPLFVLQNQRSGVRGPYDIGQELIVFAEAARERMFYITNDEPGLVSPRGSDPPAMAFLVQDGRIQRTPPEFSRFAEMPIATFLNELRTLSAP